MYGKRILKRETNILRTTLFVTVSKVETQFSSFVSQNNKQSNKSENERITTFGNTNSMVKLQISHNARIHLFTHLFLILDLNLGIHLRDMLPGLLSVDQIGHNGNNILDRNTNLQSSSSSLSNSYLLHRISLTDSHSLKQRTVLLNRIKIDSDGEGNTNLISTSISMHSLFIHSSYLLPIVTEVVSILVEKPSFFKDLEICSA